MIALLIGVAIGSLIGVFLAARQLKKKAALDREILQLLDAGEISINEAIQWRATGARPSRITRSALSPYDDD